MGVSAGLQSTIPTSANKSRMYFFWQINIPCFDLSTSIPRKYSSLPKSFISNSVNNLSLSFIISSSSSPVMIISST
ncbi:hypothetical protein HanIR_Chr08g0366361 [Helianthus annuus]|nr:hypothetical protein HanIR_Chr08g0366361 [Helianthus annuus]